MKEGKKTRMQQLQGKFHLPGEETTKPPWGGGMLRKVKSVGSGTKKKNSWGRGLREKKIDFNGGKRSLLRPGGMTVEGS